MTEEKWLTATDPDLLLAFLEKRVSDRKLRLFACACCRRIWRLLTDERSRKSVEVTERYADGEATDDELAAVRASWAVTSRILGSSAAAVEAVAEATYEKNDGFGGPYHVALLTYSAYFATGEDPDEYAGQCCIFRDIFGNPFRPVSARPRWLTPTVVALADGIYQERAFDRLPVLADALEEAGCEDAAVLAHCRGGGPHARGCWVVDLVLGKS